MDAMVVPSRRFLDPDKADREPLDKLVELQRELQECFVPVEAQQLLHENAAGWNRDPLEHTDDWARDHADLHEGDLFNVVVAMQSLLDSALLVRS